MNHFIEKCICGNVLAQCKCVGKRVESIRSECSCEYPLSPPSIDKDELRGKLKGYNWSSDKDYQLAVIAFRELVPAQINSLLDKLEAQAQTADLTNTNPSTKMMRWHTQFGVQAIPLSALNKLREELK
jgi:hypothetical protein